MPNNITKYLIGRHHFKSPSASHFTCPFFHLVPEATWNYKESLANFPNTHVCKLVLKIMGGCYGREISKCTISVPNIKGNVML